MVKTLRTVLVIRRAGTHAAPISIRLVAQPTVVDSGWTRLAHDFDHDMHLSNLTATDVTSHISMDLPLNLVGRHSLGCD